MNILNIKGGVFLLSAERQEFDTYYITEEHTKKALCNVLGLHSLPQNTSVELFEGNDIIMIFAHIPKSYYGFDDFEDVIAACSTCIAENSSLYYYDGEYILSVSLPIPKLAEFSRKIDAGFGFDSFLHEHGTVIIDKDAVNFVKNTF